jgi:hypothetical protein
MCIYVLCIACYITRREFNRGRRRGEERGHLHSLKKKKHLTYTANRGEKKQKEGKKGGRGGEEEKGGGEGGRAEEGTTQEQDIQKRELERKTVRKSREENSGKKVGIQELRDLKNLEKFKMERKIKERRVDGCIWSRHTFIQ